MAVSKVNSVARLASTRRHTIDNETDMPSEIPSTIAQAGAWLRDGRTSSVALTRELLARAKATQDTIGAFVAFTEESALSAAQRADDELSRGRDRGPLHGIDRKST